MGPVKLWFCFMGNKLILEIFLCCSWMWCCECATLSPSGSDAGVPEAAWSSTQPHHHMFILLLGKALQLTSTSVLHVQHVLHLYPWAHASISSIKVLSGKLTKACHPWLYQRTNCPYANHVFMLDVVLEVLQLCVVKCYYGLVSTSF